MGLYGVWRSVVRVANTRYPAFLFGSRLAPGEVPAFVYHDVVPAQFRADLEFLKRNGYRCLTIAEFVECKGQAHEPAVLLTFDDAVQNFFDVALPLLREFGVPATVFVPTFWMRGANAPPAGLAVSQIDRGEFMTWDELRICRDSGLVDVQFHGHRHALVPVSDRLLAFATPDLRRRQHLFDWPMRFEEGQDALGRPPLGTPIYASRPLLDARRRVLEDMAIVHRCRELVDRNGGESFFEARDWAVQLQAIADAGRKSGRKFEVVDGVAYDTILASEFDLGAAIFERELGTAPRYIAYPWYLGSDVSLAHAHRIGIEAAFGVGLDFGRIRRAKTPLPLFARLKGDWLQFLPGHGRRQLAPVVLAKVRSFGATRHLAH